MMNRRAMIVGALAVPFTAPFAVAVPPWSHRVLKAGFDGDIHHLGLHLTLAEGWKTYWRVPGSGGIPPTLTVTGENVASFTFDCPLPQRFFGADGETIGYKHEVVFPIRVRPVDPAKPVTAMLSAFVGVCEVICIPAQMDATLTLPQTITTTTDTPLLQMWIAKVPQPQSVQLDAKAIVMEKALHLTFAMPATEIFVEFLDGIPHYANAPLLATDGKSATIEMSGQNIKLRNRKIRITAVVDGKGIEQDLLTL